MAYIRPKKSFGQHYLNDASLQEQIVGLLKPVAGDTAILEVGSGMGALTRHLWPEYGDRLRSVELDPRCADYLEQQFPGIGKGLMQGDFLRLPAGDLFPGPTSVIGNFPYNISSQIVFRILEEAERVPLVIGMFQKEVAERLAAGPGSRTYGGISVLTQFRYDVSVELIIGPEHFDPPPKVDSAVIRMVRHDRYIGRVAEKDLRTVVKSAFGMRRKQLRNALKGIAGGRTVPERFSDLRAEALSVEDFLELTQWWKDEQ